jgi:protein gp37
MGDICEDRRDLDEHRRRLGDLILSTEWLQWILLTKRPENYSALFAGEVLERCFVGTTAEDQPRLEERWPHLEQVPAAVRWVSLEPLLGPVDSPAFCDPDWVVVGAESGPHARPCQMSWVQSVVRQCRDAGAPVHVKQIRLLGDLVRDFDGFPDYVKVRQWPEVPR